MPDRHLYHHHYFKTLGEAELAHLAQRCHAWGMHPAEFAKRISLWLENFDDEADWPLALKLVNALEYYSEAAFHQLLKKRQDAVERYLARQGLESARVWFAVPNDLADSATRHAHPLSKVWALPNERFISFAQLGQMAGLGAQDTLILFNDTYGSGKQFMREVWPGVAPLVGKVGAVLIVGAAIAAEAFALFKREAVGAQVIPNYPVVTVNNLQGFTGADVARLGELGALVYPKYPQGFGGCGLLLAYHFQCPNNSLPLIWADGRNNAVAGRRVYPWTALFPYVGKTRAAGAVAAVAAVAPASAPAVTPVHVPAPIHVPVVPARTPTVAPVAVATEPEGKPAWASGHGKDEFGWWAEFVVRGVKQRMRYIHPGRFVMGSPYSEEGNEDDESPQHGVTIGQGFWLADTACTQALWQVIMGDNPSAFKESGADAPVEQVSWDDVALFLPKLNVMLPGCRVSLPTEAEWEYACRASTTRPFYFGENISVEQVNYEGNYPYNNAAKGKYRAATVPVKSLPANKWGLYQMHGNVWEWCADGMRTYAADEVVDPGLAEVLSARSGDEVRALRGGGWSRRARCARSAYRYHDQPDRRYGDIGFRLALRSKSSK